MAERKRTDENRNAFREAKTLKGTVSAFGYLYKISTSIAGIPVQRMLSGKREEGLFRRFFLLCL